MTSKELLAARRVAVEQGELRRMWPGAAWDVVTLAWFTRVWNPLAHLVRRGGGLDPNCPACAQVIAARAEQQDGGQER